LDDGHRPRPAGWNAAEASPSLNGRNVLVTGGAGFIGSHLVERIAAERPSRLVVVDNLFLGKESNLAEAQAAFPGLKLYRQDASEFDAMAAIVASESIDVSTSRSCRYLPRS